MLRFITLLVLAIASAAAHAAVDVNRASQAELETVKGIGPGLSTKIVEARKAGAFKDWGDLVERVGGIGAGNAARFSQAGLTVAGGAYAGGTATPKRAATESSTRGARSERADKPAKPAKGDGAAAR